MSIPVHTLLHPHHILPHQLVKEHGEEHDGQPPISWTFLGDAAHHDRRRKDMYAHVALGFIPFGRGLSHERVPSLVVQFSFVVLPHISLLLVNLSSSHVVIDVTITIVVVVDLDRLPEVFGHIISMVLILSLQVHRSIIVTVVVIVMAIMNC